PLLDGDDATARIASLLGQRAAAYARFRAIDTSGRETSDVVDAILAALESGLRETIPVRHPAGQYNVVVGEHLLERVLDLAGISGAAAIITDSQVGPLHAARIQKPDFSELSILTIPSGERHKHLDTVRALYDGLLEAGIGRDGTIIALGG